MPCTRVNFSLLVKITFYLQQIRQFRPNWTPECWAHWSWPHLWAGNTLQTNQNPCVAVNMATLLISSMSYVNTTLTCNISESPKIVNNPNKSTAKNVRKIKIPAKITIKKITECKMIFIFLIEPICQRYSEKRIRFLLRFEKKPMNIV